MITSLTALFDFLCDLQSRRAGCIAVDIAKTKPQLTLRYSTEGLDGSKRAVTAVNMTPDAWQAWGRRAAADWWALSAPEVKIMLGTEVVDRSLLVYGPYKVWSEDLVEVYHHAGPSRIYWMHHGLREWEPISTSLHGSYAVVSKTPLNVLDKARVRDMITVTRPGTWRLPPASQDSSTLTSTMALNDCLPRGVARPMVEETSAWLRSVLPMYKVGAPSPEDVALKLDLERRLRMEEKVVGSNRPLAFTLEAIADTTFAWPGLWLISGNSDDFRTDLPVLLAWDATLTAVAAVARMHVDVKPGLCYGAPFSQTILRHERRFSKRDVGVTEGAYSQVNPARIVGPPVVVASRLLQAATHELSHLVLHQLQPHSEVFTARREQLFLTASELLPLLVQLVDRLKLSHRPGRTIPIAPVSLEHWLHEALLHTPVTTLAHLVQSWAAVRNLTEGRAQRDVEEALAQLDASGSLQWSPGDEHVTAAPFAYSG